MTIAAKHFDPQLGIDIHLYEIPPDPVPVPLPTPHIGLVFDPFDYIPFIGGTVHVNGIKRATAGTGGLDVHIPVGGMWVPPMEVAEGPQPDDQLFMGSKTVVADGAPFSRLCMPVLDCNMVGMVPPVRLKKPKKPSLSLTLPTAVNLAIPTNVSVGGPPTIDMAGLLFQAGFAGALKGLKALKKLQRVESAMAKFKAWRKDRFGHLPSGFLKCKVLRAEPVDIRDGSVVVEHEDFALPGRLPLAWTRAYRSRERHEGLCGHGWHTPADLRLEIDADGVAVFVDSARHVVFPQLPVAEGLEHAVLELVDGARLYATADEYRVRTKGNVYYAFRRPPAKVAHLDTLILPIERIEDLCGNHWRFERTDGRLTRIQESGIDGLQGRFIDVAMHEGRIRQLLLHDPATGLNHPLVGYEHDGAGDLVAALDALGAARRFEYAEHHLVRHTDRTGLSFHYEYDARHQVIHAWGDGGLYDYRFRYDAQLQETEVTDSLGHVSLVKFDPDGLPLCEIDPLDGITVFEYDDVGRTTAVVDPMGLRTEFEYDARGNLLVLTRPDGSSVQSAYDADDQPVAVTDPNGGIWTQQWDTRGLLVARSTPLDAISRYAYDKAGQLLAYTDPLGATTRLHFDRYGQLNHVVDPLGMRSSYAHDALGRLIRMTDVMGQTARYTYDAKGRLLSSVQPGGGIVRVEYDAEDQLLQYTDEAGAVTRLEYFGIGQITRRIQPDGHAVQYEYDTEERLVAVINQRGERHEFHRDPLGRIIAEIDYWGQLRCYRYDASGRLTGMTDPLGRTVDYVTDPCGRIVTRTLTEPAHDGQPFRETFQYDPCGRLVELRNPHRHVQRRLDAEGRLIEEIQDGFRVTSAYDASGRRILRESGAGNRIAFVFDACDQLTDVAINDEPPIAIERDGLGRAIVEHLSPQVRRQLDYDERGLLSAQVVLKDEAALFDTAYAYGHGGNLLERRDSVQGTDQYSYDPMGRILSHTDPRGELVRFLNDPAGDRLGTRVFETRMRQAVGGGQPVDGWTREGDYGGCHYVFDRAGNLARREHVGESGRPVLHLAWDANQRLTESHWQGGERDGERTAYGYDPLGRRVFKRSSTHTTWFFWDGNVLLGEVSHANGAPGAPPIPDAGNVIDFVSARKRKTAFEALHKHAREYVCYPGSFVPLALVDRGPADSAAAPSAAVGERPARGDRHAIAVRSPGRRTGMSTSGGLGRLGGTPPDPSTANTTPNVPAGSKTMVLGGLHGITLGGEAGTPTTATPMPPASGSTPAAPRIEASGVGRTGVAETAAQAPADYPPTAPRVFHYHTDPNGCPTRITDPTGHVVWSASYSAWGAIAKLHAAELDNPLRLQGQYFDTETGLHYNRYRYYSPALGQFVGQDPTGFAGGINFYAYAVNPLGWIDPMGLMPWGMNGATARIWVIDDHGVVDSRVFKSIPRVHHAEINGLNWFIRDGGGLNGKHVVISDVVGDFKSDGVLPVPICKNCRSDIFSELQRGGAASVTFPKTVSNEVLDYITIDAKDFAEVGRQMREIRDMDIADNQKAKRAWPILEAFNSCRK